MILIGQFDSPFVRRVGLALELYGIPYKHRPWSVFRDAERLARISPLMRVPVLVLEDGFALTDSTIILDYLDSLAPTGTALLPRMEPERHRALNICALATGAGDKAVSLFYEKRLHTDVSDMWVERCTRQIRDSLSAIEQSYEPLGSPYWHGETPGHADIAVGSVWRFIREAHPGLVDPAAYPKLVALSDRLEATEVFQTIQQPFLAPA